MSRTYRLQRVELRLLRDSQSPAHVAPIRSPEDAIAAIRAHIQDQPVESLWALYLDAKLRPIGAAEIGRGSCTSVPVVPRVLVQQGLALNAAAVVLAHNHPSGDPTPSEADLRATHSLNRLLRELEMTLVDHVIVGDGALHSMRSAGQIPD